MSVSFVNSSLLGIPGEVKWRATNNTKRQRIQVNGLCLSKQRAWIWFQTYLRAISNCKHLLAINEAPLFGNIVCSKSEKIRKEQFDSVAIHQML
jgi:hypothetical protein